MGKLSFYQKLEMLIGIDIPEKDLIRLIEKVERFENNQQIVDELGIFGTRRNTVLRAFENLEPTFIQVLLEAWLVVIRNKKSNSISPLLCVTGINPEGYTTRVSDTFQTFFNLVDGARKKILIMGYKITTGHKPLIEKLEERMVSDKIELKILTDHINTSMISKDYKFLIKWLSNTNLRFKLYSYEHPDQNELMHIKCMLIDDEIVYLGSANFSYGGSKKNIELGVVLTDKQINRTIEEIFSNLINGFDNQIVEVNYTSLKRDGKI